MAWDFPTDAKGTVSFAAFSEENVFASPGGGVIVLPSDYNVSLSKFEGSMFNPAGATAAF